MVATLIQRAGCGEGAAGQRGLGRVGTRARAWAGAWAQLGRNGESRCFIVEQVQWEAPAAAGPGTCLWLRLLIRAGGRCDGEMTAGGARPPRADWSSRATAL